MLEGRRRECLSSSLIRKRGSPFLPIILRWSTEPKTRDYYIKVVRVNKNRLQNKSPVGKVSL